MKKLQLFIILLIVLVLLALADYTVNLPEGIDLPTGSEVTGETMTQPMAVSYPNVTQAVLDTSGMAETHRIEKRTRTTELFESFDLSDMPNTVVYSNVLITGSDNIVPIYVYEIHGPKGQGKITYLNIKLKLIDQLGSSAGINETGAYGFNSLFYNDEANPNTGFLLSQIGDVVFGFKYSKADEKAFDSVKQFVEYYMSKVSN